jgi:uncharacterized protein (DUF433 family)
MTCASPHVFAAFQSGRHELAVDPKRCRVHFVNVNEVATLPAVFSQDPDVMSGVVVFRGTRIPAQTFFDHLDNGGTVDQFLEWYDGITQEQLNAALAIRDVSSAER